MIEVSVVKVTMVARWHVCAPLFRPLEKRPFVASVRAQRGRDLRVHLFAWSFDCSMEGTSGSPLWRDVLRVAIW